jgi:small-conductance mechanosensitive channel
MDRNKQAPPRRNIEPFWARLPRITRYPLQSDALATILLLAVARLLGYVPGVGWILDLVVTIAMLRYCGEVLYRTARGRLEAPTGYQADESTGWTLFWVQLALVVMIIAGGLLATALEVPAVAFIVLALVALWVLARVLRTIEESDP